MKQGVELVKGADQGVGGFVQQGAGAVRGERVGLERLVQRSEIRNEGGKNRRFTRQNPQAAALPLLRSLVLMLLGRIAIAGLVSQSYPQKMAFMAGNVERALDLLNSSANSFM